MFEELVGLIDKIKDDSIGEWIIDKKNDGTIEHPIQMPFVIYSMIVRLFEQAVYSFEEDGRSYRSSRALSPSARRWERSWSSRSIRRKSSKAVSSTSSTV